MCIHVGGTDNSKYANVGDIIIANVKEAELISFIKLYEP